MGAASLALTGMEYRQFRRLVLLLVVLVVLLLLLLLLWPLLLLLLQLLPRCATFEGVDRSPDTVRGG